MIERIINLQPWPSNYESLGGVEPKYLTSKFGREIGAFRSAIPPSTIEPPQIHLISPLDGHPFEELIADFNLPFHVAILDKENKIKMRKYSPGEKIIIPEYVVHWLINFNSSRLEFTCEYAPHPWNGERDEPEFKDLNSLLNFVKEKGIRLK